MTRKEAIEVVKERLDYYEREKRLKAACEILIPELAESEDEKIRKWLIRTLKSLNSTAVQIDGAYEMILPAIAWLEKQGEQKPTDKVEPKFKVGDWIISNDELVHEEYRVCRIEKIEDDRYYIDNGDFLAKSTLEEFDYHLWTIQYVKMGDVLYEQETKSILLVHERSGNWLQTFCNYWMVKEKLHVEFPYENYGFVQKMSLVPATKEQRDTLMKAMADAGYTFDFEKKELKKIERKPVIIVPKFHEGDVIKPKDGGHEPWKIMQVDISDKKYRFKDGYVIHFSQEDDYELVEQKPAWSEEDERIQQCLIRDQEECLEEVKNDKVGHSEIISDLKEMYRERIDWLESLKERMNKTNKILKTQTL